MVRDYTDVYMKSQEENTLAYIIQHKMDKLKLTQNDLAKNSGVQQPIISRLFWIIARKLSTTVFFS